MGPTVYDFFTAPIVSINTCEAGQINAKSVHNALSNDTVQIVLLLDRRHQKHKQKKGRELCPPPKKKKQNMTNNNNNVLL